MYIGIWKWIYCRRTLDFISSPLWLQSFRAQQLATIESQVGFEFLIALSFFRRVRTVTNSAYCLRRVRLSVRKYQRGFNWTDLRKIWYWGLFMKVFLRNLKFGYNRANISRTLHEDLIALYRCWRHSATQALSSSFLSLTSVYLLIVGVEVYCCTWSQWHTRWVGLP